MGLDAVELVLEVEEAFDICIPDARAEEIRTVGDLYDYVIREVKLDSPDPRGVCLSAATFYLLRRAMCGELAIDRRSVRPSARLESMVSPKARQQVWSHLQASLNLRMPSLKRPEWLVNVAAMLAIAAAVSVGFLAYRAAGEYAAVAVSLAALLLVGMFAAAATSRWQTQFRPGWQTLGGLSNQVLARNYAKLARQFNAWTPDDIWEIIKRIIVDQLGVKPEVVTREASFVLDLGV